VRTLATVRRQCYRITHPERVVQRRLALPLVLTILLLTGCTAANRTGVRLAKDGVPVVINCGTWIERVEVTDVDTGQTVWAAHAVRSPKGGIRGSATVALGSPPRQWAEDSPLVLDPRPSTWRFRVEPLGEEVTIVVPDAEFEMGRVYRPGNKSESMSRFYDQTCSGIPVSVSPTVLRVGFGGAALVLVGVGVVALSLWRRRSAGALRHVP